MKGIGGWRCQKNRFAPPTTDRLRNAWLDIVARAELRNPEDVRASYPKASILKAGRIVFNIKGNDDRSLPRLPNGVYSHHTWI
jgi:mRNA-degrading endonuclease HigB of HigAB toxin-antitoxin module